MLTGCSFILEVPASSPFHYRRGNKKGLEWRRKRPKYAIEQQNNSSGKRKHGANDAFRTYGWQTGWPGWSLPVCRTSGSFVQPSQDTECLLQWKDEWLPGPLLLRTQRDARHKWHKKHYKYNRQLGPPRRKALQMQSKGRKVLATRLHHRPQLPLLAVKAIEHYS